MPAGGSWDLGRERRKVDGPRRAITGAGGEDARRGLPAHALVEFILRFGMVDGIEFARLVKQLPGGWSAARRERWRLGRLADVGEDGAHGWRFGNEGNDLHLAPAAVTYEGEDLVDACQQHRPEIDRGTARLLLGGRWVARGSPGLADRGGRSELFGCGLLGGQCRDRWAQARRNSGGGELGEGE
mgnify:CR=1 FL=1